VSDTLIYYLIREIYNFGGFFGGDSVTLAVSQYPPRAEQRTLTIDERALTNVRDRHTLTVGMLLALTLNDERVDSAELIGAATLAELRAARGQPQLDRPLAAPRILSYRCDNCGLWVAGAPKASACGVCGSVVA
jgi:hypothetical protein